MATTSFTIAPISDTDARWRLWTKAIHDALIACNWVDTAATGEIDFTTSVRPIAANTFRATDYKVYRMNDALQATYPAFLKVEFGSGNSSVNNTAIRLTVGTAHDGAGTLTGTQLSTAIVCATLASTTSALQCWASGDTDRFGMAWCADNTGAQYATTWGVERTVDSLGAPNGDGVVIWTAGASVAAFAARTQTIPPSGGVPPLLTNWPMPLPITAGGFANGADTEFPVAFLYPHKGRQLRPVLGVAAVHPTDMPTYAGTVSITVYGAAHTYISIGSSFFANTAISGTSTSPSIGARMLLRYE